MAANGQELLESRVMRKYHARFGGGPGEKGCTRSTSPVAYPTGLQGRITPT